MRPLDSAVHQLLGRRLSQASHTHPLAFVRICGQCSRSTGTVNLRNVERALALVEKILLEPPATQAELMRNLQIPRSTISDLLAELRSTGYVNVLDNRHVPGP